MVSVLCVASFAMHASARDLDGVRMDDAAAVGGQTLVLNGMGQRTRFGFAKVYVAGLYLPAKTTDAAGAMTQSGAKRIEFRLQRKVEAQTFAKALADGVRERAAPQRLAALKDRLDRFDADILTLGHVDEGDVVDLDFVPATGMQIVRNGTPVGTPIAGDDVFGAVLDLFIGDQPVQASLKAGLLGGGH